LNHPTTQPQREEDLKRRGKGGVKERGADEVNTEETAEYEVRDSSREKGRVRIFSKMDTRGYLSKDSGNKICS